MRKTKPFVAIMVLIMVLCASLTACAEAKKPVQQTAATGSPAQTQEQVSIEAGTENSAQTQGKSRDEKDKEDREALYGPEEEPEEIIRTESPDTDRAEKDQEDREAWERKQEEAQKAEEEARRQEEEAQKQEEEARRQEQQSHSNGSYGPFTLEDGTVIYTEHNPYDYVVPDDYGGWKLDMVRLLYEIWGGSIENNAGYSYVNSDSKSARGLFWSCDDNTPSIYAITFFREEGVMEYSATLNLHERPKPHDHFLGTGDHRIILGDSLRGVHPDVAILIIAGLERMEAQPCRGYELFDDVAFGSYYSCD